MAVIPLRSRSVSTQGSGTALTTYSLTAGDSLALPAAQNDVLINVDNRGGSSDIVLPAPPVRNQVIWISDPFWQFDTNSANVRTSGNRVNGQTLTGDVLELNQRGTLQLLQWSGDPNIGWYSNEVWVGGSSPTAAAVAAALTTAQINQIAAAANLDARLDFIVVDADLDGANRYTINHTQGRKPTSVLVVDGANEVIEPSDVITPDSNDQIIIDFTGFRPLIGEYEVSIEF